MQLRRDKSPNTYRLLKLNDKKTIMVSPVAINFLDLDYAVNPLSSFKFEFTDTDIQQNSKKNEKESNYLWGREEFTGRNIPLEDTKKLSVNGNPSKRTWRTQGGCKPESDIFRNQLLNTRSTVVIFPLVKHM